MDKFPLKHRFTRNGVDLSQENRVLTAQFGNGYKQVAPDGINTDISTYNITWENITGKQAIEIYDFLAPRQGGLNPFQIQMPGSDEWETVECVSVSKKYHVVYEQNSSEQSFFTITASLKKVAFLG